MRNEAVAHVNSEGVPFNPLFVEWRFCIALALNFCWIVTCPEQIGNPERQRAADANCLHRLCRRSSIARIEIYIFAPEAVGVHHERFSANGKQLDIRHTTGTRRGNDFKGGTHRVGGIDVKSEFLYRFGPTKRFCRADLCPILRYRSRGRDMNLCIWVPARYEYRKNANNC